MEEPEQYSFFHSLDISIVELVVNQLTAAANEKKDDSASFIEWSEFFDLFCKLRESATQQAINVIRSKWHPATMGFSMEKADQNEQLDESNDESGENEDNRPNEDEEASAVSDNYTEDSGSESSKPSTPRKGNRNDEGEDDNQSSGSRSDLSTRNERHADSIHPCFIGYSVKTSKELEHERKDKQKVIHEREIRAITKARRFCEEKLAALEKQVNTRSQQRQQKIESLKGTFEETTISRKREFDSSAAGTTEDIFRSIQVNIFVISTYVSLFVFVLFLSLCLLSCLSAGAIREREYYSCISFSI
jgi:hypothetical protein